GDAELGLSLCDELEPFYSDYYFVIQKFRGEFLTQLRRFDHARGVYLETLATIFSVKLTQLSNRHGLSGVVTLASIYPKLT
ncbi:hypothetical protein FLL78_19375, partial [Vibrio cholerae]